MEVGQAAALLLDLGVCMLMCGLVFTDRMPGGFRRFLLATGVYFSLSMALGGMMTGLYHLFNRLELDTLLPHEEEGLGIWLFSLLALAATLLSLWGGRVFRRCASVTSCEVELEIQGKKMTLSGMVDTGNLLREPLSGRPVICADASLLLEALPFDMAEAVRSKGAAEAVSRMRNPLGLRLIPVTTAGGRGLLAGVVPDRMVVRWNRRGRPMAQAVDGVIAAAELEPGIQALVPAELFG